MPVFEIQSSQNATWRKLHSLTTSKGLKKEGLYILCGEKLVREYAKQPAHDLVHIVTTARMGIPDFIASPDSIQLSQELFDELDVVGTSFPLLILKQPDIDCLNADDIASYSPHGLELVLPIGDPGNLGAVIRSAEAFGAARVHLTQESAHPFLPKCIKASAGSILRTKLCYGPSLSDYPSNCIALDTAGISLNDFQWPENGMLIVGEEGPGLGHHRINFDHKITIPTSGVESLNAAVAASIALWEWRRGRDLNP